jgi:hypothetical protein
LYAELATRGSELRGSWNSTRSCTQVPAPLLATVLARRACYMSVIVKLFLTGQKNYHCPLCDKAFALEVYLKTHVKIHEKQDDYVQCSKCPRRFASKETLQVIAKFNDF